MSTELAATNMSISITAEQYLSIFSFFFRKANWLETIEMKITVL